MIFLRPFKRTTLERRACYHAEIPTLNDILKNSAFHEIQSHEPFMGWLIFVASEMLKRLFFLYVNIKNNFAVHFRWFVA